MLSQTFWLSLWHFRIFYIILITVAVVFFLFIFLECINILEKCILISCVRNKVLLTYLLTYLLFTYLLSYMDNKLKVIFRSKCRLNNLFQFKDLPVKKIHSGITYCFTCSNGKVTYYRKNLGHFYTIEHVDLQFYRKMF